MKKRMKLLTVLLAGVVAFSSTPASGLVFADTTASTTYDVQDADITTANEKLKVTDLTLENSDITYNSTAERLEIVYNAYDNWNAGDLTIAAVDSGGEDTTAAVSVSDEIDSSGLSKADDALTALDADIDVGGALYYVVVSKSGATKLGSSKVCAFPVTITKVDITSSKLTLGDGSGLTFTQAADGSKKLEADYSAAATYDVTDLTINGIAATDNFDVVLENEQGNDVTDSAGTDGLPAGNYTLTVTTKAAPDSANLEGGKTTTIPVVVSEAGSGAGADGKLDISDAGETAMAYTIMEKVNGNKTVTQLGQYDYSAVAGTNGWTTTSTDATFGEGDNVYDTGTVDDDACVVGTTYTGGAVDFNINATNQGRALTRDVDYKVTYQKLTVSADNQYSSLAIIKTEDVESIKEAGYYRITIEGTGKYTGVKQIPFLVDSQDFDASGKFKVNIPLTALLYTGENLTPAIDVIDVENNNKVVDKTEYKIQYKSAGGSWQDEIKDVGTYYVKAVAVSGGNYADGTTDVQTQDGVNLNGDGSTGLLYMNAGNTAAGTITVSAQASSLQIVPCVDKAGSAYTGHVIVNANGTLVNSSYYDSEWKHNNETVNPATQLQAGETYTIITTMNATGIDNGYSGSVTQTYTIGSNAEDLSGYTLGIGDAVYTGSLVKPEVSAIKGAASVTSGFTAVYLTGTDTNANGVDYEAGDKESVTIYGDGVNFIGHKGGTDNITILQEAANTLKISSIADMQYDGKPKSPDVTVTTASGKELAAADFTVAYVKLDDITYTPTGASGARKLNKEEIAAIKTAGVDSYIKNNKTGDAGRIADALDTAVTGAVATSITDAGTYVVKVTTPGSGDIEAGSAYTFAVVNPIDISDYVFSFGLDDRHTDFAVKYADGESIADFSKLSGVSVKKDNSQTAENIASGETIEVKSADPADECTTTGKHKLVISGQGNYAGSRTIEVEVVKWIDPDEVFVTIGGTKEGNTITYAPAATVKYNGAKITEDEDYTVEYYAQGTGADAGKPTGGAFTGTTVAGDYVAVIKGVGEYYNGQTLKTFTISASQKTDIGDAEITFNTADGKYSAAYTGAAVKPTASNITVKLDGSVVGVTDAMIDYINNVDAGTATLVVNGTGDYYGSRTIDFEITKRSLKTYASISEKVEGSNPFTGVEITPDVQVTDSAPELGTLKADRDYTLSYAVAELNANGNPVQNADGTYKTTGDVEEIKNAGTYIVTATGTGNYDSFVSRAYKVDKISMDAIATVAGDMAYTGQAVVPELKFYTQSGVLCEISQDEYTVKTYEDKECTKEMEAIELGTYYAKVTASETSVNFEKDSSNVVEFKVVEEAEKSVEELQKELDAAKEELEAAKEELQEAIEQNAANQAQIDELTKEVANQQAVVADLNRQIEELKNQTATQQRVAQTITVTKKKKSFKASSLKSKKGTFNIKAAAQTDLSYKTLKANNKVTVKANGKVVVKKGTKAGTYKVRVRAVAAKSDTFKKAIKNFTVTVVVK